LFFESCLIKIPKFTIGVSPTIGIYLQNYWAVLVIYGIISKSSSTNNRFSSVSDRFIEFLEKYKNGMIPREVEGSVETVIRGMTYLKIKVISPNSGSKCRYTQWMR